MNDRCFRRERKPYTRPFPPGLQSNNWNAALRSIPSPRLRKEASAEINRLIAFLDASDPYASTELEAQIDDGPCDDHELEPSLCGITADCSHFCGPEASEDLEEDKSDNEPSLGSLDNFDQSRWGSSSRSDLEQQCEDEGVLL